MNLLAKLGPFICKLENRLIRTLSGLFFTGNIKSLQVNCIVIHRVGRVGDMICALPSILAIRRKWPKSRIVLFTNDDLSKNTPIKKLLLELNWIDEVFFYNPSCHGKIKNLIATGRYLRNLDIDLWLELPQDLTNMKAEIRNLLFAKLCSAKIGVGFQVNTSKMFKYLQAKNCEFEYEVLRLLKIVQPLGARNDDLDYGFNKLNLIQHKILPEDWVEKSLLLIAPGGNRKSNRWPIERFGIVASRWISDGGVVAIIGGEQDFELGEEISTVFSDEKIINLCGGTSLLETKVLLEHCKIFVSNDSGPIHLAASIKVPMVTIFSARDFPGKWFPSYEHSIMHRKSIQCSPCFLEECNQNNACLSSISSDEVWDSITLISDQNIKRSK